MDMSFASEFIGKIHEGQLSSSNAADHRGWEVKAIEDNFNTAVFRSGSAIPPTVVVVVGHPAFGGRRARTTAMKLVDPATAPTKFRVGTINGKDREMQGPKYAGYTGTDRADGEHATEQLESDIGNLS